MSHKIKSLRIVPTYLPARAPGFRILEWGSTRVLLCYPEMWYRSPIVSAGERKQYGVVWARFVLFTSVLLFFRFGTLMARHGRRASID